MFFYIFVQQHPAIKRHVKGNAEQVCRTIHAKPQNTSQRERANMDKHSHFNSSVLNCFLKCAAIRMDINCKNDRNKQ